MSRGAWQFQVRQVDGLWWTVYTETKSFCIGYAFGHHDGPSPRLACRVWNSETGKVACEFPPSEGVSVGICAGSPSPEQYEAAARDAMARAESIRRSDRRHRPDGMGPE